MGRRELRGAQEFCSGLLATQQEDIWMEGKVPFVSGPLILGHMGSMSHLVSIAIP